MLTSYSPITPANYACETTNSMRKSQTQNLCIVFCKPEQTFADLHFQ